VKRNHLKIFVLALLCTACLLAFSSAEPTSSGPDGRYCGFVYNAGYLVRSEVVIGKTEDGRLIGTMKHPHLNITLNETGNNMISLAILSRFDTYGLSFIC